MKRIIYDVPKWHVYLHRENRNFSPLVRDSNERPYTIQDEIFDRLYTGEAVKIPDEENTSTPLDKEWAEKVHQLCTDIPDFARLGDNVRGDAEAAALATETLMQQLTPQITPDKLSVPNPFAARNAIRQGCDAATQAVDEARDAADGLMNVQLAPVPKGDIGSDPYYKGHKWDGAFDPDPKMGGAQGCGAGKGTGYGGQHEGSNIRSLAQRLRRDKRLQKIARLAGRFRRIAEAKQRQKTIHSHDEISDVVQGDDIGRLLPSELMKLKHPQLKKLLLRDLMERKAQQYDLKGTEPLGRGPIVVCIDKSGSMHGEPDIWASAVALALLDIAKKQKRVFGLINFDHAIKFEITCDLDDPLPERGLFEVAYGGTDNDLAIDRALQIVEQHPGELRKADIILIGDGGSYAHRAEALKKKADDLGVTIFGIAIEVAPSYFDPWCHITRRVDTIETVDNKTADTIFTL